MKTITAMLIIASSLSLNASDRERRFPDASPCGCMPFSPTAALTAATTYLGTCANEIAEVLTRNPGIIRDHHLTGPVHYENH